MDQTSADFNKIFQFKKAWLSPDSSIKMTNPLHGTLLMSANFQTSSPNTVHMSLSGLFQLHQLTAHSSLYLMLDYGNNALMK